MRLWSLSPKRKARLKTKLRTPQSPHVSDFDWLISLDTVSPRDPHSSLLTWYMSRATASVSDRRTYRNCSYETMVRGGTRDDERSAHYEALLLAEERGKKERKGLHSGKEPPVQHVNDMSLPGSANKWAPFGVSCPICARHLYLLPLRMQVHRSALRLPRIIAHDPSVWLGNSRTKPQVPCRARSAADKRSWSISDVSSALLCRKAELLTEAHMMTMYFQRFLYNVCKQLRR